MSVTLEPIGLDNHGIRLFLVTRILTKMRLTGWRYGLFMGTYVGIIGIACYFIILSPIINPEPWLQIREEVAASQAMKKKKSIEDTKKTVDA